MSQRTGEPGETEQTQKADEAEQTVRTGYRPEGIDDAFSAGDGPGTGRRRAGRVARAATGRRSRRSGGAARCAGRGDS